jgi:hypothetical protein
VYLRPSAIGSQSRVVIFCVCFKIHEVGIKTLNIAVFFPALTQDLEFKSRLFNVARKVKIFHTAEKSMAIIIFIMLSRTSRASAGENEYESSNLKLF